MKVLVVEDEAVSARRLVRLVQELLGPELTSIAIEPTLDLARARLGTSDLDLVFLDLDLHGDDGFDLVRHAAATFQTVVVSAHPDRAIDAFALGVVDFVAKPFTRERLALALDRVRAGTQRPRRHLAVRSHGRVELIELDHIRFIVGAGDYAELHGAAGRTWLHDKTLTTLETSLPPQFLRVHRSCLVNLHHAAHLRTEVGSRYVLVLRDGHELPVGRTRVAALRARLI